MAASVSWQPIRRCSTLLGGGELRLLVGVNDGSRSIPGHTMMPEGQSGIDGRYEQSSNLCG